MSLRDPQWDDEIAWSIMKACAAFLLVLSIMGWVIMALKFFGWI